MILIAIHCSRYWALLGDPPALIPDASEHASVLLAQTEFLLEQLAFQSKVTLLLHVPIVVALGAEVEFLVGSQAFFSLGLIISLMQHVHLLR